MSRFIQNPTKASKPSDHWETPRYAWEELKQFLSPDDVIWEPFVGPGKLSLEFMQELGVQCVGTETDFFETEQPSSTTLLLSNPPFSRKFEVLDELMRRDLDKWCLILPAWVAFSATMRKLVNQYDYHDKIQVHCPCKRISFINPEKKRKGSRVGFDSVYLGKGLFSAPLTYGKSK